MKIQALSLVSVLFLITACSSGDADKFNGVWQNVDDHGQQVIFIRSGDNYTVETRNITPAYQASMGVYNEKEHAVEFDNGNGDTTTFVYNVSVKHILGLGQEFEESSNKASAEPETTEPEEKTTASDFETTSADNTQEEENKTSCDKGDALVITGNNVRLRNEPDVTKQNILMQVHKNFEVVRIADKTVDGQKCYKVCYDGNIG